MEFHSVSLIRYMKIHFHKGKQRKLLKTIQRSSFIHCSVSEILSFSWSKNIPYFLRCSKSISYSLVNFLWKMSSLLKLISIYFGEPATIQKLISGSVSFSNICYLSDKNTRYPCVERKSETHCQKETMRSQTQCEPKISKNNFFKLLSLEPGCFLKMI